MLSGDLHSLWKHFRSQHGLTNVLHPDKHALSVFFVDKMTELVAATVPNVDPGKGSEWEGRSGEWPRAGKTKQRAEPTRRGRRADGGEGENGYKGGARETSVPIAKKKIRYTWIKNRWERHGGKHMAQCCPRSKRKLWERTRDFDNETDVIGGRGIIKDRIIKIGG